MKKLIILCVIFLTGCSNPISSKIESEAQSTREAINTDLQTFKSEVNDQMQIIRIEMGSRFLTLQEFLQMINEAK